MIFEYSTNRRSTVSRLPLRSPASSDAVYTLGSRRAVRAERVRQRRCPSAPARARRREPRLNTGESTRRLSSSSDCTSGIPALSSVASSWLKTRNSRVGMARSVAAARVPKPPMRALGLQRKDVQPLLFEVVAQPSLAVGDVHALRDLAGRGAPGGNGTPRQALPAPRRGSRRRFACNGLSAWTLLVRRIIPICDSRRLVRRPGRRSHRAASAVDDTSLDHRRRRKAGTGRLRDSGRARRGACRMRAT